MDTISFDRNSVLLKDERRLFSEYKHLKKYSLLKDAKALQTWQDKVDKSQRIVLERQKNHCDIGFNESLPVSQYRDKIKSLISENQVVIVAGETGSGKTTQLPKMCLELDLAARGFIGHTQPRRIAATSIAGRLSEELNCLLGEKVGYQIRFSEKFKNTTLIKLMTDGILLNEIKADPYLLKYQVIIIDEAHERSLNIDFLLGYLKKILNKRKDLKIIITSATINVELFSIHFNNAPIIEIPGRNYPVETIYLDESSELLQETLPYQVLSTVKLIEQHEAQQTGARQTGDILVFFSCERDIKETLQFLKKHNYLHDQLFPLFSRLSKKDQGRVFSQNRKHRKIILSTNIAETSLTISGVRYVIDTGLVRMSRYNYRSKVQQLPIEYISKSSADQRKGRCGREGPGKCFRLYTQQAYELMSENTAPEILRTNLASILLMSLDLNVGPLENFPLLESPDKRYIKDGIKLLDELQALDSETTLSKKGKKLAHLNIDPRLGRMMIEAKRLGCLQEVIIIACFLAIQDPREMPTDKKDQAREKHSRFIDKQNRSDFISVILLWNYYQEQKSDLSHSALRKCLQREFLNFMRLREWEDLIKQFYSNFKIKNSLEMVKDINSPHIHQSCLAGLLSHIGKKDELKEYIGARNRRFIIHPSSSLYKKAPDWLMCSQLLETEKLYGIFCGSIELDWLISLAPHLIKHQYSEPHWSIKHKRAMIYQTSYLFGLILNDKNRIPLKKIDKPLAREFFIRHVLVEAQLNQYLCKLPEFYVANQKLIENIHELESKSRRQDVLIEDEDHIVLYQQRLPSKICDLNDFTLWLKSNGDHTPLLFKQHELMKHAATEITGAQFPSEFIINDKHYSLSYHFEPCAIDDGVSVSIPLDMIGVCSNELFSWLVPGLLQEKCVALLKTLNKQLRKRLVPVADTVNAILQGKINQDLPLLEYICAKIYEIKKIRIETDDFRLDKLDDYYLMNIKVLDDNKTIIAQSRNVEILKQILKSKLEIKANQSNEKSIKENLAAYTSWSFDALNEVLKVPLGQTMNGLHPCLVISNEKAKPQLKADPLTASYKLKQSICTFIEFELVKEVKYLQKTSFKSKEAIFALATTHNSEQLKYDLIKNSFMSTFLISQNIPLNKKEFLSLISKNLPDLFLNHQRLEAALIQALKARMEVIDALLKFPDNFSSAYKDISLQLDRLFDDNFILFSLGNLLRYPYYLKALQTRMDKLPRAEQIDKQNMTLVNAFEDKIYKLLAFDGELLYKNAQINHFRFMIEEFRILLFDQTIKTSEKVSAKRLEKLWLKLN